MEDSQLSKKQLERVNTYNLRLIDGLNLSGIYTALRKDPRYKELQRNLADFLSGIWAYKRNQKFHESLNLFEKMGFLSHAKESAHYFRVGLEKDLVKSIVFLFSDVVPYMIQKYTNKRKSDKVIKFFISALAYINQIPSTQVQARVQSLYRIWNRKFEEDKFKSIFDKYAVDHPPIFPEIPDTLFDKRHTLFLSILSVVDLKDAKVVERASEIGELLGESDIDIKEAIKNTEGNLEFFSDKACFERLTIGNLFNDIISDMSYIREAADYAGSTDVFKQIRERRKKIIVKGSLATTLAGLTFFTGKVWDAILVASMPIIEILVNKKLDVDVALEIHDRLKALQSNLQNIKNRNDEDKI